MTGSGTIGMMVALAALAGGCSKAIVSDVSAEKLAIASRYPGVVPVNAREFGLIDAVERETDGWGADIVFEASGSPHVFDDLLNVVRPGGAIVLVGLPPGTVPFNVNRAISREVRIETVFRYANVFDRALALIASAKVDLKPLISETFAFRDSVAAFERAAKGLPGDIKLQITVSDKDAG